MLRLTFHQATSPMLGALCHAIPLCHETLPGQSSFRQHSLLAEQYPSCIAKWETMYPEQGTDAVVYQETCAHSEAG